MRKLFEVYHMDDTPIPESLQAEFNSTIRRLAPDYDLVIVNDFGHGLIHGSSIETLTNSSRFMALNTQTNSANFGYNLVSKYKSADYICIDGPEARLSVGDKYRSIEHVITEAVPADHQLPEDHRYPGPIRLHRLFTRGANLSGSSLCGQGSRHGGRWRCFPSDNSSAGR